MGWYYFCYQLWKLQYRIFQSCKFYNCFFLGVEVMQQQRLLLVIAKQQLLFIVFGIIVVGSATVVGVNLFSTSSTEINRDMIISVLTSLSSDAQAYYLKQKQFGGGGGSYKGWKVPKSFKKHTNGKRYIKAKVKENRVILTGFGTDIGRNGKSPVRVRSIVRLTGFQIQIQN